MKRLLILTLLVASATLVNAQVGPVDGQPFTPTNEPTDACGFTYSQGYSVGKNLGTSETFVGENRQLFDNTVQAYSHCFQYRSGVMEGYYMHRKQNGTPVGGGDKICFEGTRPGACDENQQ